MKDMKMKVNKQSALEADILNFHDVTDDAIGDVPATTNVDEAMEAITSHINKYDLPEELEEK